MLLSHGQATVERGFSISKEVESYNVKEDTFRATRTICDHVNAVGGILTLMLPTSNCKFQQQELDRNIWHSWKTKRSKRHNSLHERGNLSVMKWSN